MITMSSYAQRGGRDKHGEGWEEDCTTNPSLPPSLPSPVRMVTSKREVGVHILLASWEL